MSTVEIVHLRMAGENFEALVSEVRQACIDWDGTAQVRLYRHGRLRSDLMIHLHQTGTPNVPETSDFGTYLASVLRIYGIVDHSVWLEVV